jgi:flagellar motor switch protein FliG
MTAMRATTPATAQAVPTGDDGGLYRAAVVLASLDEEVAAEICRHLDRDTVQRLARQIAGLGPAPPGLRDALIQEFVRGFRSGGGLGGREYAQQLLTKVLGSPDLDAETSEESAAPMRAIQAVAEHDPHVLWRALQDETKQTIAAVVSQLRPYSVAHILQLMPPAVRTEVGYRAANLGPTSPGALESALRSLVEVTHGADSPQGSRQGPGLQFMLDVLQSVDRNTERQLIEELKGMDADFATRLEEQMVTFEDLFVIEDRELQGLLRQVRTQTLALALRGADEMIRKRALANLSSRLQEELRQEMELMGPAKVAEVEQAQREVTNLAREMEERGELDLRKEKVEYI